MERLNFGSTSSNTLLLDGSYMHFVWFVGLVKQDPWGSVIGGMDMHGVMG